MSNFDLADPEARRMACAERAQIRANNASRPRCAICRADILYGAKTAELVIDLKGEFMDGDLLCFFCWDSLSREPWDLSIYQYGHG
jgi:hypothetical protein